MIRKFLINLLFRLLDNNDTYSGIDDERIEKWLGEQGKQAGFREYVRKRDLQLLKTFGTGLTGDTATLWIGQRLELFRLMNEVNKKVEKEDKSKEKNVKKSKTIR